MEIWLSKMMIQVRGKEAKQIGCCMQQDGQAQAIGFVIDVPKQQSKADRSGNHSWLTVN
jgi:hypothetical protein